MPKPYFLRGGGLIGVFSVSFVYNHQGKENIKELDKAMVGWKWDAGMTLFLIQGDVSVSFGVPLTSARSSFAG